MNVLFSIAVFVLATFVVGDDDPPYDEQACFSRTLLMESAAKGPGCQWITEDKTVEFEKDKDRIYECYGNRFKFILPDGGFDVAKCLEAYDSFAVPEKKEAIFSAFNDCNVDGGPIIPFNQTVAFRHCFRGELADICPVKDTIAPRLFYGR